MHSITTLLSLTILCSYHGQSQAMFTLVLLLSAVRLSDLQTFGFKHKHSAVGVVDPDMKLHPEIQDGPRLGQLLQKVPPFNGQQKKDMLDMHNQYRRTVVPPASNMRFMTWDPSLERTAQQWASGCIFKHGMPPEADQHVGQNLYKGPDTNGLRAALLWYNETHDYHFPTNSCRGGETAECGHYTQIVWANSHLLGCAIASCFSDVKQMPWNYIVCHYKPPGNYPHHPYSVGVPCSGCNTDDGGLCGDNLCMTEDECKSTNSKCDCPLTCHNCGSLSSKGCRCNCKHGWDSLDCSRPCQDSTHYCGANPGYHPDNCRDPKVKEDLCRLMCKQCNATGNSSINDEVCCEGKLCPVGQVLDTRVCNCVPLCPRSVYFTAEECKTHNSEEECKTLNSDEECKSQNSNNGGPIFQNSNKILATCLLIWAFAFV